MRATSLAFTLVALLTAPSVVAEQPPSLAKTRRHELSVLDKQLFRKTLLMRTDVKESQPSMGRMTELLDGSYYENADATIAFEELGPVTVSRTALRKDGHLLLVTLEPPSCILPPELRTASAPEVCIPVIVEVDVDAAGGVKEALQSLVYLPGENPDAETVARCIARYPSHDEKRSRMRCGQGR